VTVGCVILAAGLGTRFGGPKQLVEVGLDGEPLFVLTARQARAAGADRIVVVTRSELAGRVRAAADHHLGPGVADLVEQDRTGPARAVPWGTAHAVVACADVLDGPFVVVNGDDHFGHEAIAAAVDSAIASAGRRDPDVVTVIALRLDRTLSTRGPVTRALCRFADGDRLAGLDERRGLVRDGSRIRDASGAEVPADAWVSMNLLAAPAGLPALLAPSVAAFAGSHADGHDELLLPDELDRLAAAGRLQLRVIRSGASWCGLTHRADLEDVRAAIRAASPEDPPQLPMREL